MKEAREIIAKRMNIAEQDLRELLPSGTQTKFGNRVAWAKSYFVQANVFETVSKVALLDGNCANGMNTEENDLSILVVGSDKELVLDSVVYLPGIMGEGELGDFPFFYGTL